MNTTSKHHKQLDSAKWFSFPIQQQILLIASELRRADHWIVKKDVQNTNLCYERAFELVDLTVADPKWKGGLRELLRFREALAELYVRAEKDEKHNDMLAKTFIALHPGSFNLLYATKEQSV